MDNKNYTLELNENLIEIQQLAEAEVRHNKVVGRMTSLMELDAALENRVKGILFYVGSGKKERILKFSSFMACSEYCKEHSIKNWSIVGMRSMSEMVLDAKLPLTR